MPHHQRRAANCLNAILLASALLAGNAQATTGTWDIAADPSNGFNGLTTAWALGTAGTASAEWNVFNSAVTDASPDVHSFGPGTQSVTELTGGAFLTGGGNIYSFSVATSFNATLTGPSAESGATRDVAMRIGLQGTSLALSSITLGGLAPTSSQLLFSEALGGFGGAEEEWLFFWNDVSDTTAYNFAFASAESSMSLDQLGLYAGPLNVAAVPLPATAWLLMSGVGTLGGLVHRRRRRPADN